MRVVIAGGGSVGTSIAADLLDRGHHVQVLEADPDHAELLRDGLPGVDVLWADACEVSSLHRAGLRSADVIVAVTGDDEDNLVISWLAKQEFAVPRVISRVNNAKNAWLFTESWGVDLSVSTPQLLTALVEEAVSVGSVVRLMDLDERRRRTSDRGRPDRRRPRAARRRADRRDRARRARADPSRRHAALRGRPRRRADDPGRRGSDRARLRQRVTQRVTTRHVWCVDVGLSSQTC